MAGLRSLTNKTMVVKKIVGVWGKADDPNSIPKRQLILLTDEGAHTLNCTDEVSKKVEEFKEYRFVIDNDVAGKKVKIVDVLLEDKK